MARWLGLDHGLKIIGVAISDREGRLARPLTLFKRRSKAEDFATLNRLIEEHAADAVVVGLPLGADGRDTKQTGSVRKWAARLAAAVSAPVCLWDESYSSAEAAHLLEGRRGQEQRIDDAAAAVILQSFLDARRENPDAGECVHLRDS